MILGESDGVEMVGGPYRFREAFYGLCGFCSEMLDIMLRAAAG